jgi:hypothetical protein
VLWWERRLLRFSGVVTVIDDRQDEKEAPAGRIDTGNWMIFWEAEEQLHT